MTFYHGTASTFQASILKHGLRKSRGKKWNALATKLDGKPVTALEFPGAVWISDNFELAVQYARLKARLLRAEQGEEIEWANGGPLADVLAGRQRVIQLRKVSPVYDPDAQPIIFAIEIDESEERIPACPLTSRLLRAIPPQALTLIRLREEIDIKITYR